MEKMNEEMKDSLIEQFLVNYKKKETEKKDEKVWSESLNNDFLKQFNYIIKKATMYDGFNKQIIEEINNVFKQQQALKTNTEYQKEENLINELKTKLKDFYKKIEELKTEVGQEEEEEDEALFSENDIDDVVAEKLNKLKTEKESGENDKKKEKIKIGSKIDNDYFIVAKKEEKYIVINKKGDKQKKSFDEIKDKITETASKEDFVEGLKKYVGSENFLDNAIVESRVEIKEQDNKDKNAQEIVSKDDEIKASDNNEKIL